MKSMKEASPAETNAIRKRALKSLAMSRIEKNDCDYITRRLDEIDARVVLMNETGNERRES